MEATMSDDIPTSNIQHPEKHQAPNLQTSAFGPWNLELLWMPPRSRCRLSGLDFGIWRFSRMKLEANIPSGPLAQKWEKHRFEMKLVNPANKRKFDIIVVGSGLAGASAASSLAELGYKVKCFCFQDSPRRAHSIAAQGGINAAKNYQNDGDSVYRLFYDTIKGGDFRARE